MHHILQ
jgi:hypothetical protein